LTGKLIAIWGLSFKPETDDMREAPSLVIIEKLLAAGCRVKGYDPQAIKEAKRILGDKIEFAENQYEALIDADCLLLLTEWQEFRYPNFKAMAKLMKRNLIFDGRNILDAAEMQEFGFDYFCIGARNSVK
jgi:UDPglucose 6-dehydrogenase